MDNLVTKTIEFFFVPETALSLVFLFIFVILFALGIYWEKNCRQNMEYLRENAETEYKAVQSKMLPDLFVKKYLNKISATESKMEGLPEEFVSIGIVATFLGLGVAIQGSAELLENEKLELAKLTAVLGVIAFKFQTSVWGICFSLIFQNLILNRYFEFKQETIDEVNDVLYNLERDSIKTLLEKQNIILTAQSAMQEKFEEERTRQHESLLTENRRAFDSLIETLITNHEEDLSENRRLEKYLTDNLNKFIETSKIFVESAKTFSNTVEQFRIELNENLQRGFNEIKNSNENIANLHTARIEEIHSQHERNIFYVSEKLDELHQKFYLDSKRYVEETQKTLENLLNQTVDKVNDGYIREAAEIRSTITQLNETLSAIESRTNLANEEFINKQNQFVNEWRIVTEAITNTLTDFAETSNETNTAVKNFNNASTNFIDASNHFINSLDSNLATLEISQKSNMQNFSYAINDLILAQNSNAKNIEAVSNTLQQILQSIEKLNNVEKLNKLQPEIENNLPVAQSKINTVRLAKPNPYKK